MLSWPSFDARAALIIGAALLCHVPLHASAQSRTGRQWITTGLSVAPTLVADKTAPEIGVNKVAVGGGLRLRLGLQHVIASTFVMGADVEIGNAYLPQTTVAADGDGEAGAGFAWQAGLVGRWVPSGDVTGPALGLGLHTYRASLPDTPVQTLSGDLRFGWYLWREDSFVLAEIGYAIPLLEGVDAPDSFDGSVEQQTVEHNWTLHRMIFGFSYGF